MYTPVKVVHEFRANETVTIEELNEELFQLHIPAVIFVSLCMVIGVFGNLLVLIIYKSKFQRSNHRYFILFLAFIDLCACVTGLPFLIASLRLPYIMDYFAICKSVRYIHYLVNNSSGVLLVVISAERFQRICRPFKKQMSHGQTLKACYGVVFASAIIAIPAPIFFGRSTVETGVGNLTGSECYIADEYRTNSWMEMYQGFLFLETLICIAIFAVLYTFIIKKVWSHDQFMEAMRSMKISGNDHQDSPSVSTDMVDDNRIDHSGSDVKSTTSGNLFMKVMKCTSPASVDNVYDQPTSESIALNGRCESDKVISVSPHNTVSVGGLEGNDVTTISDPHLNSVSKIDRFKKNIVQRSVSDTHIYKTKKSKYENKNKTMKSKKTSLRRLFSKVSTGSDRSATSKRKSRATIRVTIMLFTISIVFAAAFIPHLVLMLLTIHRKDFLLDLTADQIMVYQLFLRIFIINNIANPIIYGFCDKKFRKCCWDMLKGKSSRINGLKR